MKIKGFLLLLVSVIALAGCSSNRGGTLDEYETDAGAPTYGEPKDPLTFPPSLNTPPALPPP